MGHCLRRIFVLGLFAMVTPWALSQANPPAANAAKPEEAKKENEPPRRTVLQNGVVIEFLREGEGPKPAGNSTVQLNYIGSLPDGTEFDNSYADPYPPIIKLADKIGCWRSAIPHVAVGSKVRLTCPPGSANGPRPVDMIPGNTPLFFEIELLGILK